jgi:adenosylcobinamide kinase/adenosylcobinamide-phosphate guanylyltransferase
VPSSHLVLGGARSGKSRFAVRLHATERHVVLVATATPGDADMAARIARHRAERPATWTVIEEPLALGARLRGLADRHRPIIVDCLTLWVANRMLGGDADDAILGEAHAVAALIADGAFAAITLISNEVGEGVHPPTADGRRFRDLLGLVNQAIAAACDRVTLMVAGLPLVVKHEVRGEPATSLRSGPERAPEAP